MMVEKRINILMLFNLNILKIRCCFSALPFRCVKQERGNVFYALRGLFLSYTSESLFMQRNVFTWAGGGIIQSDMGILREFILICEINEHISPLSV